MDPCSEEVGQFRKLTRNPGVQLPGPFGPLTTLAKDLIETWEEVDTTPTEEMRKTGGK